MKTHLSPSLLTVYFIWHPRSPIGRELSTHMFHELCADPDSPADRGLGIPVRFRTTNEANNVPGPVPFGKTAYTAVFVLVDDELSGNGEWRAYADEIVEAKQGEDLVVPVALTAPHRLPTKLQGLQAIRLDQTDDALRATRLRQHVVHGLCRLLHPEAGRVRVFVSYARADGAELARSVRRYLREEAWVDDFFDEADIPDGAPFADFLQRSVDGIPVLLAIHTDTYSSREWCRLEVLAAKKRSVPIVVLTANQTRGGPLVPLHGKRADGPLDRQTSAFRNSPAPCFVKCCVRAISRCGPSESVLCTDFLHMRPSCTHRNC